MQEHVPMSMGVVLKTKIEDKYCRGLSKKIKTFFGVNCVKQFLREMVNNAMKIDNIIHYVRPMAKLTEAQVFEYNESFTCHICEKVIEEGDVKVRDHCHISGMYRGPAHSPCNLNYKIPNHINIFFHNLSYDMHHLIKELDFNSGDINLIASTDENYIAVSKKVGRVELRFIDSFRFLSASLDSLAKLVPPEKLITIKENFPDPLQFELTRRKGVFPYDYITDFEILKETKLPPKESFFSQLNNSHISDADYEHACRVWDAFKCKDINEYSLLYLKIDVALLADIFENFRALCVEKYSLDPCHYYTLPGLSLDSALKVTGVEIELLTDYNMFLAFEKGLRGRNTQLVKKHSAANNVHMGERYDPNQPDRSILYVDANNLYGHAMCSPLPVGSFKWVSPLEFTAESILQMGDHDEYGYLFDVTMAYPDHLHEAHNSLPFLVETKKPPGSKVPKLLATLSEKVHYVVHYVTLKQALQHGLLITSIHSVIEFKQCAWLKPYIEKNTMYRALSDTDFEKAFYKFMNNVIFGKTIENKRLHRNIQLVCTQAKLQKLINKPNFSNRIIYTNKLVACHMAYEQIVMDKPIFVGFAILELSKVIMYDFFYNTLKSHFGDSMELLYTDTDSFILELQCSDLYLELKEGSLSNQFDFSNYPIDHICYSNANKKKLGKFTDEAGGKLISEFVGLRPKVYALDFDGKHHLRCKGVKKCNLGTKIFFEDYLKCLKENNVKYSSFYRIQSKKHVLYTIKQKKLSLSCNDDKRVTLPDGIHTLAYGHCRTRQLQIENGLLLNNAQVEEEEDEWEEAEESEPEL